jgi:hypothetical protein
MIKFDQDLVFDPETSRWLPISTNRGRELLEFYIRSSGQDPNYDSGYDSDPPPLRFLDDSSADVISEDWPDFPSPKKSKVIELHRDDTCSICLESMNNPLKREVCLKECGHCLHKKCFQTMENTGINKCPICRTKFRFSSSKQRFSSSKQRFSSSKQRFSSSKQRSFKTKRSRNPKKKKRRFSRKTKKSRSKKKTRKRRKSREN